MCRMTRFHFTISKENSVKIKLENLEVKSKYFNSGRDLFSS